MMTSPIHALPMPVFSASISPEYANRTPPKRTSRRLMPKSIQIISGALFSVSSIESLI
jgi:hypothetical protein